MADAKKKELQMQRRIRRGVLTRLLNTLKATIEGGKAADRDAVCELLTKSGDAFAAIEAIHDELMGTADDAEATTLETWMGECHAVFWESRTAAKRFLAAKEEKEAGNTASKGESASATQGTSATNFDAIKLALELPKAAVSEFRGDPVHYYTFITNFETNVESKLSSDSTRLQYLLQMCTGKARSSIECCALLGDAGYAKAKDILRKQFGQPHMILNALVDELLSRRAIRANDGDSLWELIASMKKCHVTLTKIGYTSDLNSTGTLLKIQSILPVYLQKAWAGKAHDILYDSESPREPHFKDLLDFLERRAEISCTMFGRNIAKTQTNIEKPKGKSSVRTNNVQTSPMTCFLCDGSHSVYSCSKFAGTTHDQKVEMVRAKKLCFRCLRPGHGIAKCRRTWTCKECGSDGHHHRLHAPSRENAAAPEEQVLSNAALSGRQVYLRILPVIVTARNGKRVSALALLDHASDTSLCTENLRTKLGVQGQRVSYTSSTINGDHGMHGYKFGLSVKGTRDFEEFNVEFLSVPKIPAASESIPDVRDLDKWRHLRSLEWDDHREEEVGLLIGADTPQAFWVLEERRGRPRDPYAVRTPLGWSVMGPAGPGGETICSNRIQVSNERLLQEVQKSWAIENSGISEEQDSVQDVRARELMESTIRLTDDGHYEMGLLWKHDEHDLPHSKSMAQSRLASLKKRLSSDETMLQKYTEVIEGYISEGYAEPVDQTGGEPGKIWYLPHHPVVHPHKQKVRVVYDCAARSNGTSLNDKLLKGPDLMNDLMGVLLRFRQDKVAIVADIESMFHQVRMAQSDRDALRFFWWKGGDLSRPPETYRMCVHLFGATSSPCCASKALKRTADDNEAGNKDEVGKTAISIIRRGFYVDDCLSSVGNVEFATRVVKRLVSTLNKGGFRLTKWLSNERQVLDSITESERAPSVPLSLDKLPTERTLGVCWEAESDQFTFQSSLREKPMTRRGLLSVASSIYDPLGFAAPFVLVARSLLQEVCRRDADWDEPLTAQERGSWQEWLSNAPNLAEVKVPRSLELGDAVDTQLHIFCDASTKGYAAVAYLRIQTGEGDVSSRFVVGKARVSPLKTVSIPRLELMAAVLAATLDDTIRRELDFKLNETTYWSDSMVVLGYIRNEETRFKTFVANRVSKIRSVSKPSQWRHVGTKENPADEGSRGTYHVSKWLTGPDFLTRGEDCWPELRFGGRIDEDDVEVKRSVAVHQVRALQGNDTPPRDNEFLAALTDRYSSWTRLVRVLGWVLRFVSSAERRVKGQTPVRGNLLVSELRESERTILTWQQKQSFQNWQRDQRLKKLSPVLMGSLLRVGGRLDNARLDFDAKHPIILPSAGKVVKLLVEYHHASVGHSGWAETLNTLREKFWVIKGRCTVKRALRDCVECKRFNARPAQQVMAPLPAERVTSGKPPFTFTGVDYFGPIEVRQKRSTIKMYGCIFTCMVTRAVHLEAAASLDADAFINGYRRFVARRGQPEKMFSDNGKNFVAGHRELKEALTQMNQGVVQEALHTRGCEWHFNPPSASHFGGAWERLIRSVRRILHGVLKQQTITVEVLQTVLTEVESILNSRPLTDVSPNPNDKEPLTPNHLLLMRKGPDAPVGKVESCGRRRWLHVQYLASLFWTRWRKEYLPLLQKRHKWTTPKENVKVNDIVLLVDENSPRGRWPMGRVLAVYPGKDGRVRSVDVKTGSSIFKRPITKLCIVYSVQADTG